MGWPWLGLWRGTPTTEGETPGAMAGGPAGNRWSPAWAPEGETRSRERAIRGSRYL